MISHVTDVRSNLNDQIANAVKALGRSRERIAVFLAIHTGKKKIKTVTEIAKKTRLKRKRVLEAGKKLVHKQIVQQTKRDGDTAYERDSFCYAHRQKIVALARNPAKLRAFPTKYSPKVAGSRIVIKIPKPLVRTAVITVDHLDSFYRVRKIRTAPPVREMRETRFKHGVQRIIGEPGRFNDWGGETSDLYTTRVRYKQTRHAAAFAFKGRGMKGILTPARLGRNGDQIQRLFMEDADIFMVQYVGQIAPSVLQQMAVFAQSKSFTTGKKIVYGVIDGTDSAKMVAAYPAAFRAKR